MLPADKTNSTMDFEGLEADIGVPVYPRRGLTIVRGEGAFLFDAQGERYTDMMSGQGSCNLGHAHPAVVEAIQAQAQELISCSNVFSNDQRAALFQKLKEITGLPHFFLCSSGAEANEGALKFARLLTGRGRFIAMNKGFHGRTLGALAATWDPKYRKPFQPLGADVTHVAYNNLEALTEVIDDTVAGVIVEPIQGEGGVNPGEADYLRAVQDLCREHGACLVLDEIQTGFGRTGEMFAHQPLGLKPDILCLAKSIANGVPMGAIGLARVSEMIKPGMHGTTFGGNPLACAASLATIETMQEPGFLETIRQIGEEAFAYLNQELAEVQAVKNIRGRGFMIGIELRGRVTPVLKTLMDEHHILALPAGPTVLRLLPPLVMSRDVLMETLSKIVTVLKGQGQ